MIFQKHVSLLFRVTGWKAQKALLLFFYVFKNDYIQRCKNVPLVIMSLIKFKWLTSHWFHIQCLSTTFLCHSGSMWRQHQGNRQRQWYALATLALMSAKKLFRKGHSVFQSRGSVKSFSKAIIRKFLNNSIDSEHINMFLRH